MTGGCGFAHEALVYGSDEEYVRGLVPFLEEGIAAGEAVFAVVPRGNAELLRARLGASASEVTFIDADEWYQRPSRTIARYDDVLTNLGGRRARVVGEVAFGRTGAERSEWTRYEAVLNRALAHHEARVVCPYDRRALPAEVVADAHRTHPVLLGPEGQTPSERYVEPESLVAELAPAIDLPEGPPELDLVVEADLGAARRSFRSAAAAAGLDPDRVDELTVAVNEILTNACVHGADAARLRVWATGRGIVCAVEDGGDGIDDPLAGFVPVPAGATSGRGLWLARQLFDRAELARHDEGFLVVLEAMAA